MGGDRKKTERSVLIADHLWEALAAMAEEMGSDRDALVNQALHTFARLNGFLLPRDAAAGSGGPLSKPGPPTPERAAGVEVDDSLLGDESDVPTAADLREAAPPGQEWPRADLRPPAPPGPGKLLVLLAEGRELDRVVKDRFLIGRGKHCDLIINSGKVSREHAAITREGGAYFIEDLGSSNGTWFDKRRIGKRQIQDGDEYFICAEKLSCSLK